MISVCPTNIGRMCESCQQLTDLFESQREVVEGWYETFNYHCPNELCDGFSFPGSFLGDTGLDDESIDRIWQEPEEEVIDARIWVDTRLNREKRTKFTYQFYRGTEGSTFREFPPMTVEEAKKFVDAQTSTFKHLRSKYRKYPEQVCWFEFKETV